MRSYKILFAVAFCLFLFGINHLSNQPRSVNIVQASSQAAPANVSRLFLPLITASQAVSNLPVASRRVNAPFFAGNVNTTETAIFWFGNVSPTENYADVRVGYTSTELYVSATVIDRRLWYSTAPTPSDLTNWDAVTLYLNLDGNSGNTPGTHAYRFDAQLSWFEPRANYQAAYRGNGNSWALTPITFTTEAGWRGDQGPNSATDSKGWVATFHIPFASLGLTGAPGFQTKWGMALAVHNRDDAIGTPIADKIWPENMTANAPASWGQLAFGLPTYAAPPATPRATVEIRQGLNGVTVTDGAVGGYTSCGGSLDYWTQWGLANYSGGADYDIQNESDVSDYPCFSKYYVTFPLTPLPSGKVIISATLTLHEFGNSGTPGQAQSSLIQVLTVADSWSEATLDWNDAPLASENVSRAWVDPLPTFPGWPGVARTWDVSRAVAAAYATSKPLSLALYSADDAYHSGKYFVSSDSGDWNAVARPTLDVLWGDP